MAEATPAARWLLDGLFPTGGAGILGGAPKSLKSFFALEMSVAVASGTSCAGHFAVLDPGPVLLLAAEDQPATLLERLAALARAHATSLDRLPIHVIVEPHVKLPFGLPRLAATVARLRPHLLILDPLIRLHDADENSSQEMSTILDGLRHLARASSTAVLLVHHVRKASAGHAAGSSLRGSSDLWAFGDSNLYIRRIGADAALELRLEHRSAACPPPFRLRLRVGDQPTGEARFLLDSAPAPDPIAQRALTLLARRDVPMTTSALRQAIGVRKQALLDALRVLAREGRIRRAGREGWVAVLAQDPVPHSICGNRNPSRLARPPVAPGQPVLPGLVGSDQPASPTTA
jgi:hypothetical protein